MALKVGELYALFKLDTSGLNPGIADAESKLAAVGKGLESGAGKTGEQSGKTLTGAFNSALEKGLAFQGKIGIIKSLAQPFIDAGKFIYDAGAGFEAQMSRAFAIRGLDSSIPEDAEAMEALRKEAIRMASKTPFTTEEAGKAYEYMAMAGWDVTNMLAGLEPIMNLAIASGNDMARVSDIVTDALTAMQIPVTGVTRVLKDGVWTEVGNAAHFADVLAAVATNSNTNVDIMGETFKYVGTLAGQLGYSIDDVGIALGLMANSSVKGSQAGTSLRNILTRLASPTDAVAAVMYDLGIALDDGQGNMLSLRDLLVNIRGSFSGITYDAEGFEKAVANLNAQLESGEIDGDQYQEMLWNLAHSEFAAAGVQQAEAAATLAGKYGLAGLLAIVGASDEEFNSLMAAVDGATGMTQKMGDTMKDNAQGDVTMLGSAVNALATDIWSMAGNDAFRATVQGITDLVNGFHDLITLGTEGKLGEGIINALGEAGAEIGKYILSPEGLKSIFDAGVTLGGLLVEGIYYSAAGLGNFLKELVTSTLVSWGVLDADEVAAAKDAGRALAETTAQAFEQAAGGGIEIDDGTELLANWANYRGGQNRALTPAAEDMVRSFDTALGVALKNSDNVESFRDQVFEALFNLSGGYEKANGIDLEGLSLQDIAQAIGWNPEEILPKFEDLDFWAGLRAAVESGNASEIMQLANNILMEAMAQTAAAGEEAAVEAAGTYPEAVQTVMDQLGLSTEKGASDGGTIEQTMKNASAQGMAGYEAGILEGQEGATGAAAQVSDAAVQVFLLAMSEENGTTIGTGFVTGMTTGITNQTGALTQAAQLAANRVVAAAYSTASGGAGWTIGHNFGQGFVNGIRSMISAAASAASSLGSAAGNALSSATQEGSPSEWTTKIGRNFGAGFFNGIMALAGAVAGAASSLGQSAGNALSMTARDMGQSTVGSMQAPSWAGGSGSSAAPSETRSQEPVLERFTGMIVSALEHVAVQMDSETVGHLVVDTVSEDIAHRASTRRAAIA